MTHPAADAASRRPRCPTASLRIVALGGLGEVGRNMTVFEYDGRLLIVDCGVLFPEDNQPGVDLILPDFDYIRDRLDDIDAIVLTHGHEDHIGGGAVPAARASRTSRWSAPELTLALVEAKLREHRIQPLQLEVSGGPGRAARAVRVRVRRGQPLDPGRARGRAPHAGRPARAAHRRLQDGPAAARRPDHRPAGLRPARRGGRRPVPRRLHQRRGARLRHRRSGRSARCSTRCSRRAERRIIVACFASHVHRVQQMLDAAARARAQGGLRRPLDGAQHGRRPRPRLPARSRPASWSTSTSVDLLPDEQVVLVSHRLAGRADGRAVPDGQRRPPDPGRRGRHRPARARR